jgi:NAD(P)-dependent dehydrogenase (short-subunit alcohol dehydrogenase family)
MELKDTSAIITGGGSGLGAATARLLAQQGVRVTIFDLKKDQAEAVASEIGNGANYYAGDVSKEEDVLKAVELAGSDGPPLRICINCAGIGWAERTINKNGDPHDFSRFEFVIRVNLMGTFNMMRVAASAISKTNPLEANERGVIINTASVAAFDGQIGQLAYSASKGGVVGMTLPAARDLAAVGIRVATIAPGLMDTPLLGLLPEPQREALAKDVVFPRRLGNAAEFASLAVEICRNSYLNGEVIRLDGALRMPPK